MPKLGIAVGEENWWFFRDVYDDLRLHYQTQVLKTRTFKTPLLYGRLNRWARRLDMNSLLRHNDLCFFEWASDYLAYASALSKQSAIVARLHSFELYEWAPRIDWNNVDRVILISRAMQHKFCSLYPDHAQKTTVIRNGIKLDSFSHRPRRDFKIRLGMLCSITSIKRVYEAILMLHELRNQGCHATLRVGGTPHGDFRYAAAVFSLVERLGLQNAVTFDGYVDDTATWFNEIDIFISNSYWESQQVALSEAMASSCYCLAHRWDGVEEILPDDNLYFTDSELRRKIAHFTQLPQSHRLLHGEALRAIAYDLFDIRSITKQIREVIDQEVQTHR